MRFRMSTGIAETYVSASMTEPSRICRPFTEPSSLSRNCFTGALVRTSPPRASMCAFIGAHSLSGWLPSRKAIWRPSSSFRKRFIAVSTTVIESLSGSMKSSALPIAMKISSLILLGIPYFSMNCSTESSSCASIND